ncbi:MAG: sulfite exporter TauE/SafE family protein [Actinomycetota bacterium]
MPGDASSAAGVAAATLAAGRWWRLLLIGAVAGMFSTLFGVGGGIVMVPLLLLLLRYDAKAATATSLAAIVFTSVVGSVAHGAFGNVEWDKAVLLGVPAVAGVLIGQAVNRRVSNRTLTLAFAVFLVAIAVRLVLE